MSECAHPPERVTEQLDDTFETLMGVELLVNARLTRVCDLCGETIRDRPNPKPVRDFKGVRRLRGKKKKGKKKPC